MYTYMMVCIYIYIYIYIMMPRAQSRLEFQNFQRLEAKPTGSS